MPKSNDTKSIVVRIKEHYDALPKSELKIADFILDFPGDIASYTATELAELSGVSKAAVTRLIRRLEFNNFEEARRLSRDARSWGSPLYLLSQDQQPSEIQGNLRFHLDRDIANMTKTFETLDEAKIHEIVKAISQAPKISILGFRNSHYLATYTRFQLLQLRGSVHLMAQGGETLAEGLANLDKNDLIIAFGFRRRLATFRNALKLAHKSGIPILYITDPTAGPTENYAKWVLHAEVAGVGVFDSYTAAMSLIHHLCSVLLTQSGQSGRDHLKRIEDNHDTLHDFE